MTTEAGPQERVEAFLAALQRLSVDDLTRLALPAGDQPERAAARGRALDTASSAGLADLVREASRAARELVIGAFASHQYEPTWAGLQWSRSLGTARDRASLIAAVEDAALAAVLGDRLAGEDVELLAEPYDTLASLRSSYPDLSLPHAMSTSSRARSASNRDLPLPPG